MSDKSDKGRTEIEEKLSLINKEIMTFQVIQNKTFKNNLNHQIKLLKK